MRFFPVRAISNHSLQFIESAAVITARSEQIESFLRRVPDMLSHGNGAVRQRELFAQAGDMHAVHAETVGRRLRQVRPSGRLWLNG